MSIRYILKRTNRIYYNFIEREAIKINYSLYEEFINNVNNVYIDHDNKTIIIIEAFFIANQYNEGMGINNEDKGFLTEIRDQLVNLGAEKDKFTVVNNIEEMMLIISDNIYLKYTAIKEKYFNIKNKSDTFNNFINEYINNYKSYNTIIIYNNILNIYKNRQDNIHVYEKNTAFELVDAFAYDISKIADNINIMLYNKYKNYIIEDKDDFFNKILDSNRTGIINYKKYNISICLPHYRIFKKSISYKCDESLIDPKDIRKDFIVQIIHAIVDDDVTEKNIYLLLTDSMIKTYNNYKQFYDMKINTFSNKKIHIFKDSDFLYNPLESKLLPDISKIELTDMSPIILSEINNLPKLSSDDDIVIRYLGFNKGDIIKINYNYKDDVPRIIYKIIT
ncbi:hypothetical protein HDU92_007746 [Lobulomyces angularis]|nr:hypothetical protein HDU92_007746 [Lobulomyces angularis]